MESTTYHDNPTNSPARDRFTKRLARMRDMNSLVARATADRVAVHSVENYSIGLEFKTNQGGIGNMAIEALPLALHRSKAAFGCRCLYVYRDVRRAIEGCFWAHQDIPANCLYIPCGPDRRSKYEHLLPALRAAFPSLREARGGSDGSGDPFLIVPESRLKAFLTPDWRGVLMNPPPAETTETRA